MKNVKKIIMITGISSGVGESLTQFFLNQNYKVIGMARRTEMVKKSFLIILTSSSIKQIYQR